MAGFDFGAALRSGGSNLADAWNAGARERRADDLYQRQVAAAEIAAQQVAEDRAAAQEARTAIGEAVRTGNFDQAAATAYGYGQYQVGDGLRNLSDSSYERAGDANTAFGNIAATVRQVPYEQRRGVIQALAPRLTEMGIDAQQIAEFDPTDDNLLALASIDFSLKDRRSADATDFANSTDRIKAENPIAVADGGALVTRDGQVLYQAPKLEAFGIDQNVYEVGGTGSDGYTTTTMSMNDASSSMANAFGELGASPAFIAAALANAHHESGFNPELPGDDNTSFGYFQHRDLQPGQGRATTFERVMGVHPSKASPEQTARFVMWELTTPEGRAASGVTEAQAKAILNEKDPARAAMLFQRYYERPKKIDPARGATANGYMQTITGRSSQVQGQRTTTRPIRQVQQGQPKTSNTASGPGGKPLNKGQTDQLTSLADQTRSLARLQQSFDDKFAGNLAGNIENLAQSVFSGVGTEGQREWWADMAALDNAARHELFGAALTATEQAAWRATTINPRMDPKVVRQNLQRRYDILRAATDRMARGLVAGGSNTEQVRIHTEDLGISVEQGGIVTVQTIEEARALPRGTRFRTPDGRVKIR